MPILSNPFSSCFVRPQNAAFCFHGDATMETILERLAISKWRGQIVGSHGSGKTTLLYALARHLRPYATQMRFVCSRRSSGNNGWFDACIPGALEQRLAAPKNSLLCSQRFPSEFLLVDGFDELCWLGRRAVIGRCRRLGTGLVTTCHRGRVLPTLVHLRPTVDTLLEVVRKLGGQDVVCQRELEVIFRRFEGNIRETLFHLYDIWESSTGTSAHLVAEPTTRAGQLTATGKA